MNRLRGSIALLVVLGGLGIALISGLVPLALGARTLELRQELTQATPSPTPPLAAEQTVSSPPEAEPEPSPSATESPAPSDGVAQAPGESRADAPLFRLLEPIGLHPVLDERFEDNRRGWPSSPASTAWLVDGSYHLSSVSAGRFVAVRTPTVGGRRDVVVTGAFQKIGGPPGGGYGLIVRDQSALSLDGTRQDGHYYVFEVGDVGFFGVWRREDLWWVDLVPWSASPAVRPGQAINELTVRAIGQTFSFDVNGVTVAEVTDAVLQEGHVGLFVGGDGNQVSAERLVVQSHD